MTKQSKPTQQVTVEKEITKRLQVQFDITYKGTPGRVVDGDNKAEPDLALSVRQIKTQHQKGQNGDILIREPLQLTQDFHMINDLNDLHDLKQTLEKNMMNLNSEIKKQEELKKQQKEKPIPPTSTQIPKEPTKIPKE